MNSSSARLAPIQPYERLDQLHQAAANAFCELVDQTLTSGETMRVSLSGGSTPKRLYELLSQRDLPWDKIHWFWGDERNVPADHPDSNFRMVREALLNQVTVPAANIHAVPVNVDDPASAAAEYEQILHRHFPNDPFPQWDLVLLGMGDDAHTASLFPATEALAQDQRWFIENWVEEFDAFRYTLTAPAINSAKHAWFLVAGGAKAAAVTHVLGPARDPHLYPSQLIRATRWFITKDAYRSPE